MIFAQSRYENSRRVFASDSSGNRRRIVEFPAPRAVQFSATRHIAEENDRMDLLAARYFNDPEMWWVIAEANPELFYPEDIRPGTVVRIPSAPSLL